MITTPQLEFAFQAHVQIAAPLDLGITREGHRRVIPILGGTVEGPQINGRVVPGGADWQILHGDGAADLEARYTLECSDALIYVTNRGYRRGDANVLRRLNAGDRIDPAEYYFRTVATFETSAPEFQWLADALFVGSGERQPDGVIVGFWRVL
jgi:hypothetical protein